MQITGKVVCVYQEQSGTYLGSEYRYVKAVVVADEPVAGTDKHDHFVVNFKNEMIAQAQQSGCLECSSSYVFTIEAKVEELQRQDGTKYAIPRSAQCYNIEPAG